MKVVRQDQAATEPMGDEALFVGKVLRQPLVTNADARLLSVTAVTFRDGARNRWHVHEADQVLVVTHGRGIVATEAEEARVSPGDIVFAPAGERHWHGAEPGHDFTHLSILTPGKITLADDD